MSAEAPAAAAAAAATAPAPAAASSSSSSNSNSNSNSTDASSPTPPKSGELLFAGCAAHSMAGRNAGTTSKFDGVEDRTVDTFSRVLPNVRVSVVVTGNTACHFFCLTPEGAAYAWGRNEDSQLGFADEVNRYRPTLIQPGDVPGLKSSRFTGGACGVGHSVLFTNDGKVYSCGRNVAGQCGVGKTSAEPVVGLTRVKGLGSETDPVVSAGAGKDFTVAVTASGSVFSWGSPENGQLGNGTEGKTIEKAGKYTFAYRPAPGAVPNLVDAVKVVCGTQHSVVMDRDGKLFSWGFGGYGRLGHNDNKDRFSPEPIAAFAVEPPPPNPNLPAFMQRAQPRLRAADVSCGAACTYAIGRAPLTMLYFWGITKRSGEATMKPFAMNDFGSWRPASVASGFSSTIVSFPEERPPEVVTWGPSPVMGELGYGSEGVKSSTKPKEVDSLRGARVLSVQMAYAHSFVVVDVDEEQSRKVVDASPVFEPDEVGAAAAGGGKGKKTAAAASSAASAGGDKKKAKR